MIGREGVCAAPEKTHFEPRTSLWGVEVPVGHQATNSHIEERELSEEGTNCTYKTCSLLKNKRQHKSMSKGEVFLNRASLTQESASWIRISAAAFISPRKTNKQNKFLNPSEILCPHL